MRKLLLAAALIPAVASAATALDSQAWGNVTLMSGFGQRGLYFLEAQPRFGAGAMRLSQLLLRGGVGLQVTDRLGLYAGYLHMILPLEGGRDNNEERPFIQLMWQMGRGGGRQAFDADTHRASQRLAPRG